MNVELLISSEDGKTIYQPAIEEGIEWTTERRSAPGKLTFSFIYDENCKFTEGGQVRLKLDDQNMFFGFVFKQTRDKDQIVTVTAYDQLRYLQNKDTYLYENKTASDLIKMLAADFELQVGEIEDTSYNITSRVEENTSLFDMIENALDLELTNRKEMFVLYDDFGKLALKNISNMAVGEKDAYLMIDESTGENFEYTSTIDSATYNKIKLAYENEETGKRDIYIAQDSSNINKWGILQYFDVLEKGESGSSKADALLSLYNNKTRHLKIINALGDARVRAGSMIVVNLNLGDVKVQNWMMVERCVHRLTLDAHFMDLTLRGGEFHA